MAAVVDQRGLVCDGGAVDADEPDGDLILVAVVDPHDRCFQDLVVSEQEVLHLEWGDVDATGPDHLRGTAGEVQPAFVVELPEVTGAERADFGERGGGLIRLVEIAG